MGMSRDESDKCDTWGRPLDDRDDTCATILITLCVSVMWVYIAEKSQTHKDKPLKSLEQDCKHDKAINMPKYNGWLSKKMGEKYADKAQGMGSSVYNHQSKNQGGLQSLSASQNFGGCFDHYNT